MVAADAWREQQLLTLLKAAAARDALAAVVQGRLSAEPSLLIALAGLVRAAAHHAALAEKVAA